jgi:hypothetical protein
MTNLASLWADGPWSPIEVWAEVPAPVDEVYDMLADPGTYPAWLLGAQRIDETEGVEVDPPHRRVDVQVHAGPFHGVVDFEVMGGESGTCRVCFRESATGPFAVLTPLLRPLVYARNGRSLKRLADLLGSQRAA